MFTPRMPRRSAPAIASLGRAHHTFRRGQVVVTANALQVVAPASEGVEPQGEAWADPTATPE